MSQIDKYTPPTALARFSAVKGAEVQNLEEFDTWINAFAQVAQLAEYIAQTEFVPRELRGNPAAITACILTGREMHLGPMASLKHIFLVRGRPGQSAEIMRAKVFEAGHEIRYIEQTDRRVVVAGRRSGQSDWTQVTFTIDQAKAAGIAMTGAYTPEDKLVARATSRLCRRLFADCISGLPTVDELEDNRDDTASSGAASGTGGPAPTARKGTAQRRNLTTGRPSDAAVGSPESTVAKAPMPPLPGEPETAVGEPDEGGTAPEDEVDQNEEIAEEASEETAVSEEEAVSAAKEALGAKVIDAPPTPESTDRPITAAQVRALQTMFHRTLKVKTENREDRLVILSGLVGRTIRSTSELTYNEASGAIDAISKWAPAQIQEWVTQMRKTGSDVMDSESE